MNNAKEFRILFLDGTFCIHSFIGTKDVKYEGGKTIFYIKNNTNTKLMHNHNISIEYETEFLKKLNKFKEHRKTEK